MSDCGIDILFDARNGESLLACERRAVINCGTGNSSPLYLTFEIYPEHNPVHPKRYFGTWQFLLKNLGERCEISFSLDASGVAVSRDSESVPPNTVLGGRYKADDLYRVFVVLADCEFKELARAVFYTLISFSGSALDPLEHWPGGSQRQPPICEPAYLSLKSIARTLAECAGEANFTADSRILDVGCAHKPYYPFFADAGCEYFGVDIFDGQFVDAVWPPGTRMPVDDDSFDFALCSQVLEHAVDPKQVVAETHRALRKGGGAFFSAPFAWEEHDYPADYWRFSREALRLMFGDFSEVEVKPCGNSAQCLAELLNLHDHRNRRPGIRRKLNCIIRNWIGEHIAVKSRAARDFSMPSNYIVIARK